MREFLFSRQVVIFDLDGTLVDSLPDLAWSVDRMLESLGREPAGLAKVERWIGNGGHALVRRALADDDHGDRAGYVSDTDFERGWAAFQDFYADHCAVDTRDYPGVRELLGQLADAGIRLACVSNKPYRFTTQVLEALELAPFFGLALGGDSLAEKKPSPVPLQHALAWFDCAPEAGLMIGDSRHDVDAARAAELPVYCVEFGYNHGEPVAATNPDGIIASYRDLL